MFSPGLLPGALTSFEAMVTSHVCGLDWEKGLMWNHKRMRRVVLLRPVVANRTVYHTIRKFTPEKLVRQGFVLLQPCSLAHDFIGGARHLTTCL
jgi:hypothetical protein